MTNFSKINKLHKIISNFTSLNNNTLVKHGFAEVFNFAVDIKKQIIGCNDCIRNVKNVKYISTKFGIDFLFGTVKIDNEECAVFSRNSSSAWFYFDKLTIVKELADA